MSIEVTFGQDAAEDQRVRWLLRGIESWPSDARHVEIIRPLRGGRSGGGVLLAVLHRTARRMLCVVKVDEAKVLRAEWQAYEQHIKFLHSGQFAPIVAAMKDAPDGELGVVVYGEASDFIGRPGDTVRTLEEVVRTEDLTTVLAILDQALRGASTALHTPRIDPCARSLSSLNHKLGPNLVLAADDRRADWVPDQEVLLRTLCGVDTDLQPGARIRLRGIGEDGAGQGIRVVVEGRGTSGTVISSRGRDRRALLLGAVRPFSTTQNRWHVDGISVADPFAALPQVLTEVSEKRVYSYAHGDLNAGNIVVVGSQVCFIDYAHTANDAPQQTDYAWLEVSLLRDVFAVESFAEIVRVQRALAYASRLLQLGMPSEQARTRGRALMANSRMFEVLFTVRAWAHACYPHEQAGLAWWRDHLCHLLLSAHRTLKWSGDVQTEAKLRAMAATAAVCTEWLTDGSPFTHWPTSDREYAVGELRPLMVRGVPTLRADLQDDHDTFVDLVAEQDLPPRRGNAVALVLAAGVTVLTGPPRSGKTRVLMETAYRVTSRIPVLLRGNDLSSPLVNRETLATGAVHLMVDDPGDKMVDALITLHQEYPDVPILVTARHRSKLPFPEVRLKEVDEDAIVKHLRRCAPADKVDAIAHTLLDDPLWTPFDIRRPQALAMLAGHLRAGELPSSPHELHQELLRTKLGDDFARAQGLAMRELDDGMPEPNDTAVISSADRDFLAALALAERPVTEQVARLSEPSWEEALRLLAARPNVDRAFAERLAEGEPVRAGSLLRVMRRPSADVVAQFVQAQQKALRDEHSVEGLRAFGDPIPVREVACDQHTGSRMTALELLVWLEGHARPGSEHRMARLVLRESVHNILGGPADTQLRVRALEVVAQQRLRGLELFVAAHLAAPNTWPLVRQAAATLKELDVALTEPDREAHDQAARAHVRALTATLHMTTNLRDVRALCNERDAIIEDQAAKDLLLEYRFAFDGPDVEELLSPLVPSTDPASWLTQVEQGTAREAIEAAHLLLRYSPHRAAELLTCVEEDPKPHHVLIAAAAVDTESAVKAEDLLLCLLPKANADLIEGISALLVAIFHVDRLRGTRLAWTAARTFTARDLPERHYWPWKLALIRCRGTLEEHDAMLQSDDPELAIEALASYPSSPGRLSTAAEEQLWQARPGVDSPPDEIDSWARAVTAVRMVSAIPHLMMLAKTTDASISLSTNDGVVVRLVSDVLRDATASLVDIDDESG